MHLHITTILFIIFEHINKIFTQGIPISPCPKMFQYRFDGAQWFGILSVRNPDFGQALHLRVILSMRGKPTTNYLGEIELLTRGQFLSEAPVLYKIKFPKNHFPPKLLQITTNNHVVCLGTADHSIFVTQIQLEHTRKFTFLSEEQQQAPPLQSSSSSSSSVLPSTASSAAATATTTVGGSSSISMLPITTGLKDSSMVPPTNIAFGTKHLPLTSSMDKNPLRISKDICGTIDDRIRFQVMKALKQKSANPSSDGNEETARQEQQHPQQQFSNPMDNIRSILSTLLLQRKDNIDEIPAVGQRTDEADNGDDDDGIDLPPLVTTDIDGETDFFADDESISDTGSLTINELPTITRGAWPWLAAVYVNNLTSLAYQCGGTLISTRIVVSAAHCFQLFKKRYTANEVLVFLGRHNLKNWNEEGSVAAPVDDIFIHPDYNQHLSSYDADIAVVVLKNEVRYNTFIRPACMWTGSTSIEFIEGEPGIVVGWGLGGFNTTKQMSTTSTVPKIISTPVVSNNVCFAANPKYKSLTSNRTFCAGIMYDQLLYTKSLASKPLVFNKQLHQGPCTGDSGAGLMIFRNNRWVLRGTVSGSLPMFEMQTKRTKSRTATRSCSINQYVVYTDVAKFLDWIFAFVL
ncbi:serine protease gd [Musca domestica]|uniref:Serine protease gd n=1 Tax=Musca domestica TaxID=7370 RepID=A0A1I8N3W8_MUSDO|nr:serine protease gd [Musca domestica]